MADSTFEILTVGWHGDLIRRLLAPIHAVSRIRFSHVLVGRPRPPDIVSLGMSAIRVHCESMSALPEPDLPLLASLEAPGVPTIHNMILGDYAVRQVPSKRALGYATFLARRFQALFAERRPDVVMASFDSLHSGMALAVSKQMGLPFVAMAFTAVPQGLTGFCSGLSPDDLLPLRRPLDQGLRNEASALLRMFREAHQPTLAYVSAPSLMARLSRLPSYGRKFVIGATDLMCRRRDFFLEPSLGTLCKEWMRRNINFLSLPRGLFLASPPSGDFALFPLHMQPESSLDTWAPFFMDQMMVVRQISQALPPDLPLLVKPHFSDIDNYSSRQLKALAALPGVKLVEPTIRARPFVEKAALIFGIQGTVCLEAALLGKPVLMFGDSPYLHFPATEQIGSITRLPEQIRRARSIPPPTEATILEALADYLSRYMEGILNDWSRPIGENEITRIRQCFERLAEYFEGSGR